VFNNDTPKKGERYTPEDSFFMLENGRRYFTSSMRLEFRAKITKIACPILVVQGDVARREIPINKFNADVLIPALQEAGKDVEVSTYPKQEHCFCAASGAPRPGGRAAPASWPAAALRASQDIQAFCHRHVTARPNPIDASLITQEVVRQGPIA
jgi:acetyl esterase/lipase